MSHFCDSPSPRNAAYSWASIRWQRSLIDALVRAGTEVLDATMPPLAFFPRGPLIGCVRGAKAPILNVPVLRELHQLRRLKARLAPLMADRPPDVAVSFEISKYSRLAGEWFEQEWEVPWIPIVGEGPPCDQAGHPHNVAESRRIGVVYLSHARSLNSRAARALHIDGGIDWRRSTTARCPAGPGRRVRLLSTGGLPGLGADLLLRSASRLSEDQFELHLVGRGWPVRAGQTELGGTTVVNHGQVDDAHLDALAADTDVFVCCYPMDRPENHENFPSKLLYFLGFGRPVVSTMTGGLSPEYRDVVIPVDRVGVDALVDGIQRAATLDVASLLALHGRIEAFVLAGRSWDQQAAKLLRWIRNITDGDSTGRETVRRSTPRWGFAADAPKPV